MDVKKPTVFSHTFTFPAAAQGAAVFLSHTFTFWAERFFLSSLGSVFLAYRAISKKIHVFFEAAFPIAPRKNFTCVFEPALPIAPRKFLHVFFEAALPIAPRKFLHVFFISAGSRESQKPVFYFLTRSFLLLSLIHI